MVALRLNWKAEVSELPQGALVPHGLYWHFNRQPPGASWKTLQASRMEHSYGLWMCAQGVCSSLILFVLVTQLWAIKIGEHIGIARIQDELYRGGTLEHSQGCDACFRNLFIWAPRSFLCVKVRLPFIREEMSI